MKKTLSIIFILVIIVSLAACNEQSEQSDVTDANSPTQSPSQESTPLTIESTDPDAVNIVSLNFYGDQQDNLDWKEIWPRLVEERYGVQLIMSNPAREYYMETILLAATTGELTGIVELLNGPFVEEWKLLDLIYPLTGFLANNEVWNTIVPDNWKSAYKLDDEIWAIPTGTDGSIPTYARNIRGDWLDKFSLGKPYTLDEFYEASYNFTYNDPDGNGIDDTVGFTSSGLSNLRDIFQAYDARLNHSEANSLIWNPNTDIWEDSMIKPEMVECLSFLNKCYSEGVLDSESFNGLTGTEVRDRVSSGLYGGTMTGDAWILYFENNIKELYPEAYLYYVGALTHKIDKNINPYYTTPVGNPRVLMKNTPQPEETINWFVNTFYGDEWGFWTSRIGPVGDYRGQEERVCTVEGKTIVRNTYIDSTGSIKTYPGPGFIGGMPSRALYTIYEVAYYIPSVPEGFENWGEEMAERPVKNTVRRNSWIEEYIENGMLYLLPDNLIKPTSDEYYEIREDINTAVQNALKAAITGEMSIEDAISQYSEIAQILKVKEILDIENEKLGKVTD